MGRGLVLTGLPRTWGMICALFIVGLASLSQARSPDAVPSPRWDHFSDIVFRHFTQDNGLPFTGATVVAEDRHGLLWIGSQSGLARWDGQRFRLYQAADHRSGLRDDLIKVLHVDPQGRLWVGTNAGGMARYDPAGDRFVTYAAGTHGLSHAGVRAIEDDGRGGLWVATSGGLDHVDPDARTIRRYRHIAGRVDSLPADHVSALLNTPGGLWVGTRAGLSLLSSTTGAFRAVRLPVGSGIEQPAVTSLTRDDAGILWIGTAGAGAFRYDPATMTVTAQAETGSSSSALATQTISSIAAAGPGKVWIATGGNGVVVVDTTNGTTRRLVHDASTPSSLADDAPVSLFRARNGVLWIGTQRGLSRYDPSRTGIWTLLGGARQSDAISSPDVTAVLAARDGRIWLGLGSKGAEILDPSRETIAPLFRQRRAGLPPVPVSAFAELPGGHVLIGTNAGLFESDMTGTELVPFGFGGSDRAREVTALLHEGSTLWIGRLDGLWRLRISGSGPGVATRVAESSRLADQRVMSIARGSDGALWIGTQNGLHRLVPGSGRADRIDLGGGGADGLVPTVLADTQGRIWAGVYGHGIVLIGQPGLHPSRVRHIDIAQGLPDANVDTLLEDGAGQIWASTDGGLAVIDPLRYTVRALRRADAVAITAYWSGSGMRTADGQLLFGGLGGLTIVDPRKVAPAPRPPSLVVTEIRAGGRRVAETAFNDRNATAGVTIHPNGNSLFVEFAMLDYADAAGARYAYRLRGFQDEWTDADASHRSASYTNLPPGDYVLEVRGTARNGRASPHELHVAINVLPAWYQTLWFELGLVCLCLAAIFSIMHLRTAVLRRRQRQLERLVADRTAALRASQRELEQIAYIDVLTGLPNRRMFNDAFRACLDRADRKDTRATLLLIDLDHFKTINDTYGHDAGDALLTEVAIRLQALVGEFDILARLGGDEFGIVMPNVKDVKQVDELCKRITRSLAEPVAFGDLHLSSGASIGIALHKRHAMTPTELYKASDIALYQAKKRGRGSFAWFAGESMTTLSSAEMSTSRRSRR